MMMRLLRSMTLGRTEKPEAGEIPVLRTLAEHSYDS